MTETTSNPHLIPVTQWSNHHAYPPLGQLRAMVFNAEKIGFDVCIRRIGKRVLIDEQRYFRWVEDQNVKHSQEALLNLKSKEKHNTKHISQE